MIHPILTVHRYPCRMIVVTAIPELNMVRAVMSGMLTVAEVERFAADEGAAVRSMGLKSGEFVLLVETLGNLVQTQEVTSAFEDLILNSLFKSRKIATVRDGVLTRMQTRRILRRHSRSATFDSVAEAEAWLLAPDEPVSDHGAGTKRADGAGLGRIAQG